MSDHKVTCTDEPVRLVAGELSPGTVARCACGWSSSWWVSDGSAECDGDRHMRTHDPEYRARQEDRERVWAVEREDRAAKAEETRLERLANTSLGPESKPADPCHECSCHINPPCGACENCKHWDEPDCDNDCQDCEEDHE